MFKEKAHDITSKIRTEDVIISDDIRFKDLLLSPDTLKGLEISGFKKPSPIQKKAIPLGRCGFDLIVQAKSGTGKTCVFSVIALEMLQYQNDRLQVLILSPTREISFQIKEVISSIGRGFEKLKVSEFIGGTPLNEDKVNINKCQIAVGTPGRVKHLISENIMKLDCVRLFVLDEADRLMEDNFRKDISFIYLKLPRVKQSIAVSATFPPSLENFVIQYMSNPVRIAAGTGEVFLLGIRQFVTTVPCHMSAIVQFKNKLSELARILSFVPFNQCLVFSNYQSRGESICSMLNKLNWPAVCINGSQQQKTRLKTISSLKDFQFRVLVSTDLTSRGIDAENINLVVNLDLPYDSVTYMHRIGRAGRYGTPGLALTIVEEGSELIAFQKMLNEIGGKNFSVSLLPKGELNFNVWEAKDKSFEQIFSVDGEYKNSREKKCADKTEEMEKLEESSPRVNEKVEFLEELSTDQVPAGEKHNLKSYDQLLKLLKEYEKPATKIDVSANNKNLANEKIQLNSLSRIRSVEASWKNFKKKIAEVDLVQSESHDKEIVFPSKTSEMKGTKISKNYVIEPAKIATNDAIDGIVENDGDDNDDEKEERVEERNIKNCNSSINSKETIYTTNNISESVENEECGKRNKDNVNKCYFYLKKDTAKKNFRNKKSKDKEYLESTEEEEEKSVQRVSNSCLYLNEKERITTNGRGDDEEELEDNEEKDTEQESEEEKESEEETDEEEESEEEEQNDCEDDPCEQNSLIFRNWYSSFYLQMSTMRQYITYLKQFNYYNELNKQLRK